MKRRFLPTASFVLAISVVLSCGSPYMATTPAVQGESSRTTTVLHNGVTSTNIKTSSSSVYGLQNMDIVEFDLSQRDLYVEVGMPGAYITSARTVLNTASAYNTQYASSGKRVLAAMNGDLWCMAAQSTSAGATGTLRVPRGITVINGEIVSTPQLKQEDGTVGGGDTFWSFGVTSDYVPLVGKPRVDLTLTNSTRSYNVSADGINRLPANDALIIYTPKCGTSNMAAADAYEVVVESLSGPIRHGSTVTGVVTAISSGGSTAINSNRIILSARGSRISDLQGFQVGDTVKIDASIWDEQGRTSEWRTVNQAIGGFIPIILDGSYTGNVAESTYPSTVVGIKEDGNVIFMTNDGRQSGFSLGAAVTRNNGSLLTDMGVYSAFLLDGGGSTTMVQNRNNTLQVVNRPSDGSARAVGDCIMLLSGPIRKAQGANNPESVTKDPKKIKFDGSGEFNIRNTNDTVVQMSGTGLKLTTSKQTQDPYVDIALNKTNTFNASSYKYMVVRVKGAASLTNDSFKFYLCAGSTGGATELSTASMDFTRDGQWHSYILDLTSNSYWTGDVNAIRLDYLDGATVAKGSTVEISEISFFSSSSAAQAYIDNGIGATPAPSPAPTAAPDAIPEPLFDMNLNTGSYGDLKNANRIFEVPNGGCSVAYNSDVYRNAILLQNQDQLKIRNIVSGDETELAIEMLLKINTAGDYNVLAIGNTNFNIVAMNKYMYFGVGYYNGQDADSIWDPPPRNEWIHLVYCTTMTGQTMYVNGEFMGTRSIQSGGFFQGSTLTTYLGSYGRNVDMYVADLNIYDTTLSQSVVTQLYDVVSDITG